MQMCWFNDGCDSHRLACAGTWNGDTPSGLGRWEKTTGGTGETATGGDNQETKTSGDWDEAQGETKISGIYKSSLHINLIKAEFRPFTLIRLPKSRLLSCYLPVRKDDFDLHGHIEAAGHNPDACFHLAITDKTCRGFLVKMGGKIKTWKKRWFVFDHNRRTFTYYAGEAIGSPTKVCSCLSKKGCAFILCCRQTRDQDERSHILPSHRGGLLWPLKECTQSESLYTYL